MKYYKLILNTTFLVDLKIEEEWYQWMRTNFIPVAYASEGFEEYKLMKILTGEDAKEASYAMQFKIGHAGFMLEYNNGLKKELFQQIAEKWGEACLHFSTIMEIFDEG